MRVDPRREEAEHNHWSERGRATSVAKADALGRPRRSVLALDCLLEITDEIPKLKRRLNENEISISRAF